ncbi:hypothetical protein EX30DRAFT_339044 [Ascodesmis nigricans]|uniref:Hsp90 chaperone protein kinase-targeting subunit n=1 Tax=Ascodesmis nigricans TaxID=341454 RepID=A0A4S2N127_9PEZI|nr:hypothetical protein EX30DRAFT_339044 [Ascodesmis nigricans]
MVLDYSKWDNIELSDDSDIEVHPNVDKRSFINAKRRQIHETRHLRKQQLEHYKTEIAMNGHLLKKLDQLIETWSSSSATSVEEKIMNGLIQLSSEDEGPDVPKPPPNTPSYAQMLAALVDTIKKEIDAEKPTDRWAAFMEKLRTHRGKLQQQTVDTGKKLADLEKEDKAKITSDDLHDGFSVGHLNKDKHAPPKEEKKKTTTKKVHAVEQLNTPAAGSSSLPQASGDQSASSGADADVEEEASDTDDVDNIEPSTLGREFAKIKIGEYKKCLDFIAQNPGVVAERETDGLLVEAFDSQISGKDAYAKQCVHQALLLQYCRQLGRDGVNLFFKRITTPNHQAQKVFHDDVNQTYSRIRERAKEIALQREKGGAGVEQIQLHAVDPNTTININIPDPNSDDPEVQKARNIFECFPPGLQRALESGNLDEVNKVLGKMSVEEAEEVVGQLGEGGMLSLEEQIIDATTDDGKKYLDELQEQEKRAKEAGNMSSGQETETPATSTSKGKEPENPLIAEVD